jgi:hypothetical protein
MKNKAALLLVVFLVAAPPVQANPICVGYGGVTTTTTTTTSTTTTTTSTTTTTLGSIGVHVANISSYCEPTNNDTAHSFAVTVPAGADKLWLAIAIEGSDNICESANNGSQSWASADTGTPTATNVAFNTSETFAHGVFAATGNSSGIPCIDVFYLDAPTATTANITFNVPTGGNRLLAMAVPMSVTATGRPPGRGNQNGAGTVTTTNFASNSWNSGNMGLTWVFVEEDEAIIPAAGWTERKSQSCEGMRLSFTDRTFSTSPTEAADHTWTTGSSFAGAQWEQD